MGIDVVIIDEQHARLSAVLDPGSLLSFVVDRCWSHDTSLVCLRFVDPYGNTVFNQLQLPTLISELRASEQASDDPQEAHHLRQIIALVEEAIDQVHLYVKFIGD